MKEITVKSVWQHTSDSRCDRCGRTIRLSTSPTVSYYSVEVGQLGMHTYDGIDICPDHNPKRLSKWIRNRLQVPQDTEIRYLEGLHQ